MVVIATPHMTTWATKRSTEHLSEQVGWEATACVLRRSLSAPELIEVGALLGIAQDLIGFLDLLELLGVTRWFIRVKSKSEFAIGFLDVSLRGASIDA
jgi:hypothetical protein